MSMFTMRTATIIVDHMKKRIWITGIVSAKHLPGYKIISLIMYKQ